MGCVIDSLTAKHDLLHGNGVTREAIDEAAKTLELSFADEYADYLEKFGIAAYGGHELTGITKSPRVDVVAVTLAERQNNPDIPLSFYVVERTGVEEIIIWQNESGVIFSSSPNEPMHKLCDSLSQYIIGLQELQADI